VSSITESEAMAHRAIQEFNDALEAITTATYALDRARNSLGLLLSNGESESLRMALAAIASSNRGLSNSSADIAVADEAVYRFVGNLHA
jgi:hypothetical protein